jgi:hypothetical protein
MGYRQHLPVRRLALRGDLKNNLYLGVESVEKGGAMMPNLLLWAVLLGVAVVVFNAVASLVGRATDGRIRRKCRRNHGRVIPRRSGRSLVTLSAKTAKA